MKIESFLLEKTFKIIKYTNPPNTTSLLLNHVPKCHITDLFQYLQGCRLHRLPDQTIPIPNHLFCENILTDIQSKLPLA